MLVEDLDAIYEEIFKKNDEIQSLFNEVKDYNEILVFLYETSIQRPNATLNSMIDTYESLILKLRELHTDITNVLDEFGIENELAEAISANDELGEKVKELMLWRLRRIFMVYDKEPILPYTEQKLYNLELIPEQEDSTPDDVTGNPGPDDSEEDTAVLPPEGGVFPEEGSKNPA